MKPEEIVVYQSIALADMAAMRHGSILLDFIKTENNIDLFVIKKLNLNYESTAQVGLSSDEIVFAVLRGLVWIIEGGLFNSKRSCPSPKDLCQIGNKILNNNIAQNCDLAEIIVNIINEYLSKRLIIALFIPEEEENKRNIYDVRAYPWCPHFHNTEELISSLFINCDKKTRVYINKALNDAVQKLQNQYNFLQKDKLKICFKSMHGEIARSVENARSLPDRYANIGSHFPPLLIEPKGIRKREYFEDVLHEILEFFKFYKCRNIENIINSLRDALKEVGIEKLTKFQRDWIINYLNQYKIREGNIEGLIVAPTGSGKTIIFNIIAITLSLLNRCKSKEGLDIKPVVIAYPRKTLESEQVKSLAKIILKLNNNLEKIDPLLQLIILIRDGSSPTLDKDEAEYYQLSQRETITKCKDSFKLSIRLGDLGHRHCIEESGGKFIYKSDPPWLMDIYVSEKYKNYVIFKDPRSNNKIHPYKAADIIITNYSMIHREFVEILGYHSVAGKRSVLSEVIEKTSLLIFDEIHMASSGHYRQQIQNIFAIIQALRKEKKGPRSTMLSSATLADLNPIKDIDLDLRNVFALIIKQAPISNSINLYNLITGYEADNVIYVDYYDITWKDLYKLTKRIGFEKQIIPIAVTFWQLIRPSIFKRGPLTTLLESLISIVNSLRGIRSKNPNFKAKSIVFVNSKNSLKEAANYFYNRYILESGDLYDRLLLVEKFNYMSKISSKRRKEASALIRDPIITGRAPSLLAAISDHKDINSGWRPYYSAYHNLSFFITKKEAQRLSKISPSHNYEDDLIHIICSQNVKNCWILKILEQAKYARYTINGDYNSYLKNYKGPNFVLVHHGDVTPRLQVDQLLQNDHELTLILATSTLEVGLNIRDVIVTVHYQLPTVPGRIIQQVGRSGRDPNSGYIRMGIAIIRPNAWETPKLLDHSAVEYFLLDYAIRPGKELENPRALAQLCLSAYFRVKTKPSLSGIDSSEIQKICNKFEDLVDKDVFDQAFSMIMLYEEIYNNTIRFRLNNSKSSKTSDFLKQELREFRKISKECVIDKEIKKLINSIDKLFREVIDLYEMLYNEPISNNKGRLDPLIILGEIYNIYEKFIITNNKIYKKCQNNPIFNKDIVEILEALRRKIIELAVFSYIEISKLIEKYNEQCSMGKPIDIDLTQLIPPGYFDLITLSHPITRVERIIKEGCEGLLYGVGKL